ncbi:GNAT family N-acetyltransferase [Oricola cellulosilytica]|uniref:N-acetyltransferase n=1 Tax=Oricola cellulosilytica TaxID=1429082 RepID=A0A4R0P3C9_9HYPH|nr:N-acetyltransferase [Oricola cellulosilytica]TCD11361.1 N-acetyltransferase [Oricola cellulosilytica]
MEPLVQDGEAVAIEQEAPGDVAARDMLLDRAMGPRWRKKTSQKIRQGRRPADGLAFVARSADGGLAATVRLWNIEAGIDPFGRPVPALLLGPLAIDPALKGCGVGAALMRHAIAEAARLGHGAVLLVGDAPYYERFGFTCAKTGAIALPGPVERERFLAVELVEGWLDGAAGMVVPTGRYVTKSRVRATAIAA